MQPCPVCETALVKTERQGDRVFLECPRCGPYSLSSSAESMLQGALERTDGGRAILSYALYRMAKREQWAMLSSTLLENILANTALPSPMEQLDNLVLWYGENQKSPGDEICIEDQTVSAVGVPDEKSLGFVVEYSIQRGLLEGTVQRALGGDYYFVPMRLTLDGWQRYYELQQGHSASRIAFMAMQFGSAELDAVYAECFKPAVTSTGFTLKRLDEGQPAGLIDDRLRVEIRQAQFLIADLSTGNKGAYWEAGYAEGLGKPVIYTCRKDAFHEKTTAPHFDTNHHLTVVWEPGKLGDAAERLKATIRATLPEDAQLSD